MHIGSLFRYLLIAYSMCVLLVPKGAYALDAGSAPLGRDQSIGSFCFVMEQLNLWPQPVTAVTKKRWNIQHNTVNRDEFTDDTYPGTRFFPASAYGLNTTPSPQLHLPLRQGLVPYTRPPPAHLPALDGWLPEKRPLQAFAAFHLSETRRAG